MAKKHKGVDQESPAEEAMDQKGESDMDGVMDDHAVHADLKTLMDAHHIKNHPQRMAKVHALAGRHKKAIKSIDDLKTVYDQKFGAGAKKKPGGMGGE